MSTITPSPFRHRAEFLGDHLLITMPSRAYWWRLPLLCIWLVIWYGIGFSFFLPGRMAHPIELIWTLFWFTAGFFTLFDVVWQCAGKELLEASPYSLNIRRQIFGLGWTRAFVAADVHDLRVSPQPLPRYGRGYHVQTPWRWLGPLAFDYGAKTYRFGAGIDEAEAKHIVKLIQSHFPKYLK